MKNSVEELRSSEDKWLSYINIDDKLVNELKKTGEDVDAQREVLSKYVMEDWLSNIFDAYDWVVSDITNKILTRYKIQNGRISVIKPTEKKAKQIQPWKKSTQVSNYSRENKSIQGYSKGYKRWSSREEAFVKSRPELPSKVLQSDFSKFFGYDRSLSSLSTKRNRLK